nr:MAG TPA: hypothetical protein [Caudoviricetes sp.]
MTPKWIYLNRKIFDPRRKSGAEELKRAIDTVDCAGSPLFS